ncbi:MAG TPA: LysR family transcriptional regulator [Polyangiaceae bacterium]|nr:LysR family transcriptional regulator [Polyangiaceae bacterium]
MIRDVRGLLAFAAVVESKSFSGAASRLGVTKSAVSKLVRGLEAELSVQLLVRTTRRLALTEVGERVYESCARLVQDLEGAEQAVATHRSVVIGHLRITAPVVVGRDYVLPLLAEFLSLHPQVTAELDLSDGYVDLLERRMDLAVRAGRTFVDSTLVTRRLADARFLVCGAPKYLARRGTPKVPTDLGAHDFVLHGGALEPARLTFHKGRSTTTVALHGRLACSDGAATVEAAVQGFGLVVAPEFEFGDHVSKKRLVVLFPDFRLERLTLSAVLPPHRHAPTKVRAFVDFVASRWQHPPWLTSQFDRR